MKKKLMAYPLLLVLEVGAPYSLSNLIRLAHTFVYEAPTRVT